MVFIDVSSYLQSFVNLFVPSNACKNTTVLEHRSLPGVYKVYSLESNLTVNILVTDLN